MNVWKSALTQLSIAGKVLAQWKLKSENTFFMYLPKPEALGQDTIEIDDPIAFGEIVYIEIFRRLELGKLTASNDVERCRELLSTISGIAVLDITLGIRVVADKYRENDALDEAASAEVREAASDLIISLQTGHNKS